MLSFCSQRHGESKGEINLAGHLNDQDHTGDAVPLSERKSPLTLGLLWLTMVTGFPTVLVGFEWYKAGLTLCQVLVCVLISCLMLLAYSVPATFLGAKSGQTYGLLSRSIFGRWGSRLVSFNLVWICIGWYGLTANFLAQGLDGLFHFHIPTLLLACVLAALMAVNNLFGFSGVANFARYLAAPILIAWVGFTFFKAVGSCPPAILSEAPHQPFSQALTLVSSFVIGYAVWGNEADYWRYGKPKVLSSVIPLVVSIAVGQVIFPVTGWMVGHLSGITDYAAATSFMNQYSFGGISLLAAVVLIVAYFAVNDSGLYGAINALENIREMPRLKVVLGLMIAGIISTALLSYHGHAFELVSSLSCVFLPSATVIMLAEYFIVSRICGKEPDFSRAARFDELPAWRVPAVIALLAGCTVGVATSGIIPGLEALHFGVCSIQAWITALVVYTLWRLAEHRMQTEVRFQDLVSVYRQQTSSEAEPVIVAEPLRIE